jgi:hypothetical protein
MAMAIAAMAMGAVTHLKYLLALGRFGHWLG